MRFDILIKDGFVVDGTRSTWYRSDVGIEDVDVVSDKREYPPIGKIRMFQREPFPS